MAIASGFEKVFISTPVFRAEKSHTRKHATEFTGFDLEFSYIDSYEDVMVMEEEYLTATPSIQWFPGHMAKTRRLITENL